MIGLSGLDGSVKQKTSANASAVPWNFGGRVPLIFPSITFETNEMQFDVMKQAIHQSLEHVVHFVPVVLASGFLHLECVHPRTRFQIKALAIAQRRWHTQLL